jgi:hypothetical protein
MVAWDAEVMRHRRTQSLAILLTAIFLFQIYLVFDMLYFLLISVMVLGLWIISIICVSKWLDHRSYEFISKEIDVHSVVSSYDEVFYTKNPDAKSTTSTLNRLLFKLVTLIYRS